MNDEFSESSQEPTGYGVESSAEDVGREAMIEEGRAAAILAYIPFLCFIPLIRMRDNPFALRHGKQGLLLFLIEIVAVLLMFDVISDFFWGMVLIVAACLAIVGIVYSIQGKEFTIPFLGDLADKLKI